jgi:hypothetical protein
MHATLVDAEKDPALLRPSRWWRHLSEIAAARPPPTPADPRDRAGGQQDAKLPPKELQANGAGGRWGFMSCG